MQQGRNTSTIRLRHAGAMLAWLLLSACASNDIASFPAMPESMVTSEVADCRNLLGGAAQEGTQRLDAANIRLVNWNVQKNRHLGWQSDFAALISDKDLVLVQEVSFREDSISAMDGSRHWSFAPGYQKRGEISGVLTMSRSKPIAQCSLVNFEPLLRTPKATGITRYGLTSTDETLVVVNIHAVNFSMGLGAFERQFDQVRQVLRSHAGPIILSGDFNTWRKKRKEVVARMAQDIGLTSLSFEDDYRVTMFGNHLDHIYVRGLSLLDSSTEVVNSSDHNPMSATLRL